MVEVHDWKNLKKALRKRESKIQIVGEYAEKVLKKYSKELLDEPYSTYLFVSAPVLPKVMKTMGGDLLKPYRIESYAPGKLIIKLHKSD